MYDKLFVSTCGMFNLPHFIVIGLFFAVLWILLRASRNLNREKAGKLLLSVAVVVTLLELVKIVIRVYNNEGPDSWIPLYYCSLFIPAIWFSISPWQHLRTVGFSYMTMGGIAASVFFIVYPSTALGMYPLLHLSTIHSLIYHLVMCYCGILILKKGLYVPHIRDVIPYSLYIFFACTLAALVNERLGTNCMFLENPFGLPFLTELRSWSKPAYMLIVTVAQSVGMFCACFGLWIWHRKAVSKVRNGT